MGTALRASPHHDGVGFGRRKILQSVEIDRIHTNGTPIPAESMAPSRDKSSPESSPTESVVRSVTAATAAAHRLANAAAADKTVLLAQVGALIAHEVNNLLSPALSRCDVVRGQLARSGQPTTQIDSIEESVGQAASISRTILDVASGELDVVQSPVAPCILQVVTKLLPLNARHRIEVGDLDPTLGVAISSLGLSHIILNVVLNALEATHGKLGRVRVSTELGHPGDGSTRNSEQQFVAIVVSDNGTGTDASSLSKCYRTSAWSQGRFVGRNLGTLLCRLLVERAGGEIEVDSERGRGTTVWVWLPRADYSTSGTSTTSAGSTDSDTELSA